MRALSAIWQSLERHPWRWTLSLLVPLILLPRIDLTIAGWFFDPVNAVFPARSAPMYEWVRRVMPYFLFAGAGYVAVLWAAGEMMKQVFLGVSRRVALYLLSSLALGPGLIVNVILKDNWGRPRPSTIREFGGANYYVPPLVMTDQCDNNCSFSSGHGALGFWPVAVALLVPAPWRGAAMAAALLFGGLVGFVRIAQGGHFFSDVVFSAVIVISTTVWLNHRILGRPAAESWKNN
ncbi:phosphatase PAP2 family protein [Magnetospirillum sulfuroxidans]|uniref:Phosphatase PAP2 family protein n=1 Tax=Magnetospirillum sulfuroxidans TaxID=611300 RepID=A0ABS5IBM4_9PROT|nr:phosphatase PAP2 family protein [Magnetospirillum sulfuroxidans]MBR9971829.1 phosphatase PAP2 family protein [Magnetospirillum sulfuroxidans]